MRKIIRIFKGSTILCLLILFNCDKNSTKPKPSDTYISVTGDLNESYEAVAFFGVLTYSSDTTEKKYFSIHLLPKSPGENELAMTLFFKSGTEPPLVDTYNIGEYTLGDDIPENAFGASFSGRDVTDWSGYIMTTGELIINETSSSNISGEFEMSGYYVKFFERDRNRTVNITGSFNATPYQEFKCPDTRISLYKGA